VERTDSSVDRNFKKVGSIGRVPSSNYEDEIKSKLLVVLYELMNSILSLL
jgi:hypothetical protein